MSMTTEITVVAVLTELRLVGAAEVQVTQQSSALVVETELSVGIRGPEGPTPYEEWLAEGNTGSYEDFLSTIASLASGAVWTLNSW